MYEDQLVMLLMLCYVMLHCFHFVWLLVYIQIIKWQNIWIFFFVLTTYSIIKLCKTVNGCLTFLHPFLTSPLIAPEGPEALTPFHQLSFSFLLPSPPPYPLGKCATTLTICMCCRDFNRNLIVGKWSRIVKDKTEECSLMDFVSQQWTVISLISSVFICTCDLVCNLPSG